MMKKTPLCPERIRNITGSFAFIEHRFLRQGFFSSLSHPELVLYVFLILAADRNGLSYYSFDRICALLKLSTDAYIAARNALIQKDLIAFDGFFFQVLSLPDKPRCTRSPPGPQADPARIRQLIRQSLGDDHDQSTHHL